MNAACKTHTVVRFFPCLPSRWNYGHGVSDYHVLIIIDIRSQRAVACDVFYLQKWNTPCRDGPCLSRSRDSCLNKPRVVCAGVCRRVFFVRFCNHNCTSLDALAHLDLGVGLGDGTALSFRHEGDVEGRNSDGQRQEQKKTIGYRSQYRLGVKGWDTLPTSEPSVSTCYQGRTIDQYNYIDNISTQLRRWLYPACLTRIRQVPIRRVLHETQNLDDRTLRLSSLARFRSPHIVTP